MDNFNIHDRLLADCHRLGRLPVCHVLLHRNATLPWFILVPETTATDLLDLPAGPRDRAIAEAAAVSAFVKHTLDYPKVNFGAIGNLVPQLHLHVIGRRPGDPCWPAPVWGHLEHTSAYEEPDLDRLRSGLEATCGLAVIEDEAE
jgi:diadenosine tetraphosphate (Ap4A) HIT family hydrolase